MKAPQALYVGIITKFNPICCSTVLCDGLTSVPRLPDDHRIVLRSQPAVFNCGEALSRCEELSTNLPWLVVLALLWVNALACITFIAYKESSR